MDVKQLLDNYLGKKSRITEKDAGNGFKEVCDLDTGSRNVKWDKTTFKWLIK